MTLLPVVPPPVLVADILEVSCRGARGLGCIPLQPAAIGSETILRGALDALVKHRFTTWDDIYRAGQLLQLFLQEYDRVAVSSSKLHEAREWLFQNR